MLAINAVFWCIEKKTDIREILGRIDKISN